MGAVPRSHVLHVDVKSRADGGYRGFYSFEWEKRWHPEIEEPEVAIAQYAEVASGYLRRAPAS